MPHHTVRTAIFNDAPEIARLLTALGHSSSAEEIRVRWAGWTEAGNQAIVAAEPIGRLLGMITLHRMIVLHRPKPVGRITALIVEANNRACGIGTSLVAAAEANLFTAGCGLIEITSNDRLVDAHAFYQHLGYERTSIRLAKNLTASHGG